MRFPGLLLDDVVCILSTVMDLVTRVSVDVAGVACSATPEHSMMAKEDEHHKTMMMTMSHEPDREYDVIGFASADSTVVYDTPPLAIVKPLMDDGDPLVLAS